MPVWLIESKYNLIVGGRDYTPIGLMFLSPKRAMRKLKKLQSLERDDVVSYRVVAYEPVQE